MAGEEQAEWLECLGYHPRWLESGLINSDHLRSQVERFSADDADKNTEHYRAASLQRFLEQNTKLTDDEVEAVLELGKLDPEPSFRPNFAHSLIRYDGLTDQQFEVVASHCLDEALQRVVTRQRLLRRLRTTRGDAMVLGEAIKLGDRVVHESLLEREDLTRGHVEQLATNGANKAIRNRARQLLGSRRFKPRTEHRLGISLPPDLVEALRESGEGIVSAKKLFGDDEQLVGFSDFREDGPYSTSTLYVTTQSCWAALCSRLGEIRSLYGVESRTLQYKSRKNWQRNWEEAIDPWLQAIRETPGLLVCFAFSGAFRSSPDYQRFLSEATKALRESGTTLSGKVLASSVLKLAPFLILAPTLPKEGAFSWYSDHDALTSGAMEEIFMEYAQTNLRLGGSNLSLLFPCYAQQVRLPENVHLALSASDIASGVLSDWLPEREGPTTFDNSALDAAGFRLLAGLAQLSGATEPHGTPGRLHISIVDPTDTGWIHNSIKLNASE